MAKILGIEGEKWILYTQIAFTAIAFIFMVALSYVFMSSIIRTNLRRNAMTILSYTESHIEAELDFAKDSMESFANEAEEMIASGADVEDLHHYVDEVSAYIYTSRSRFLTENTLYGYFTMPDGSRSFYGMQEDIPGDYVLAEQKWYRNAITARGEVTETQPEPADSGSDRLFTYSVEILHGGISYGVLCLDVNIGFLVDEIINTATRQGGYGMLLNKELRIVAHANPEFVGLKVSDPRVPISSIANDLGRGVDVLERKVLNFKLESSVGFFRPLNNGWTFGFLTPEAQYYADLNDMIWVLAALGFALSLILIFIIVKTDSARVRAVSENKQKSMFLANMSHEIRTPINAIVGMTTIGKTSPDIARKDYCFVKIDNASHHLLGVINDILDMSKIEADKFELSPSLFNFRDMLDKVENVISFRTEQKNQTFSMTVDKNIPEVIAGDEQRLIQVMINLLSNAVKFTPEGGNVKLDARLVSVINGRCTIHVDIKDTGIGIEPENLEKIFQTFEQADNSTSRKFGGTGLGLGISKRIVEMMGGQIQVTSVPEKGSVFSFFFRMDTVLPEPEPKAEIPPAAAEEIHAEEEPPAPADDLNGAKILLAEDVDINREIILAYMEDTGAEIDCAENGVFVLEALEKNPDKYGMIFMDVQMPEMDGLEATRRLRERGFTLPVVACTANVFKEDIEKCVAAGMNDYLSKPVNMEDFIKMAKKYCGK